MYSLENILSLSVSEKRQMSFQMALKWRENNIEMVRIDTNYKNYEEESLTFETYYFLKEMSEVDSIFDVFLLKK